MQTLIILKCNKIYTFIIIILLLGATGGSTGGLALKEVATGGAGFLAICAGGIWRGF